jgi:cytochrome c oxidase subunit 2
MRRYVVISILVIVSTYLIHAFLMRVGLLPPEASTQSIAVDNLFYVHYWMISFLFSLVMVTMIYSLIAFRRRKGEQGDGVYLTGMTALEITWTAIPFMAVLVLSYVGAQTLGQESVIDPTALVVKVTAGQWYWQFSYPAYGISSSSLYLPVQTPVDLQMTSVDVIHDFYVPEFRIKQDIVPGRTLDLRITPSLIGKYTVECAVLCGTGHSYMTSPVVVVSQSDFQLWVAQQQKASAGNPALLGQQLATQYGCVNCHSEDGTTGIGPTWLHLYGSPVSLSDGTTVTADDTYLQNSITEPNLQIVAGFPPDVMPQSFSQVLSQTDITDIIAFIKTLK